MCPYMGSKIRKTQKQSHAFWCSAPCPPYSMLGSLVPMISACAGSRPPKKIRDQVANIEHWGEGGQGVGDDGLQL